MSSFPCSMPVKLGHPIEGSWKHLNSFTSDAFARSRASPGKITEVLCRANLPGIETLIMKAQLHWVDHVVGMGDTHFLKTVVFPKLATGAQNIGCPLKGFKDSLKVYRGLCGIPSLGCNTPHCLEKGHSRLWWTGAVQPKSEATSPQGEETQPKYYCHMPSVWSHPCFQLGAVFSPTVSLTSSSLALNFHETHAIIIFIHSSKMKLCWSLYK